RDLLPARRRRLRWRRIADRRDTRGPIGDDLRDGAAVAGPAGLPPAGDERLLDVRYVDPGDALHALLRVPADVPAPVPAAPPAGHLLRRWRHRERGCRHPIADLD